MPVAVVAPSIPKSEAKAGELFTLYNFFFLIFMAPFFFQKKTSSVKMMMLEKVMQSSLCHYLSDCHLMEVKPGLTGTISRMKMKTLGH
jgi:hypothetical protein